ncbi:2275_t:CDS:1 [Paraglomus occultum]|uniref:2275_t:CDS:1 n=1 Tax=Paraglomus occultum TaxID=144539 RepID=A0A9N9DGE1_9GLOM|nr:2275_t:CDS:1 [Paraglomus occultum]
MVKKTLLLVGRTGSGKSTLANILINKEEKFEEGRYSVSKTKTIQIEEFELEGKEYQIIDTVGFGDMKMEPSKVLSVIVRGCRAAKKGISQVLFVVHEKFTQEEIDSYNILIELFDKEIANYTTIVRTKFSNFENEEECKKDVELLIDEDNETITKMIDLCKRRIIYVDNPPISIAGNGKRIERQISLNKEVRGESRKILLKYLES